MRRFLYSAIFGGLCIANLTGQDATEPKPGIPPLPVMTIKDALDAFVNGDVADRNTAIVALGHCTDADIPVLEEALKSGDVEVRNQAKTILKKLRKAALSFQAKFTDGELAANLRCEVAVYLSNKVNPSVGRYHTAYYPKEGDPNAGPVTVLSKECTFDEKGMLDLGTLEPEEYIYNVTFKYVNLDQQATGPLRLLKGAAPITVTVQRGIAMTFTILDQSGKPIPEAKVIAMDTIDEGISYANMKKEHEGLMPEEGPWPRISPCAVAGKDGIAKLWWYPNRELGVIALATSYKVACQTYKSKAGDGGEDQLTIKLTQPPLRKITLTFTNGPQGPPLKNLRLVLADSKTNRQANPYPDRPCFPQLKDLNKWILDGAIEAGNTGENGQVQFDLRRGSYYLFLIDSTNGKAYTGYVRIDADSESYTLGLQQYKLKDK